MNDVSSREEAPPVAAEAAPSRRLRVRPLLALIPYVMRYRGQVAAAMVALLVAAAATLVVPLAVRRMIDFGFSAERIDLIDQYFAVMLAVAAVLAIASATRYYLVTNIGERVVADLRAAVFAHLTALAPAFFDTAKTGETHLAAHRRHHADQEPRSAPRCRSRCATSCCSSAPRS